jgi:hypothetical protein
VRVADSHAADAVGRPARRTTQPSPNHGRGPLDYVSIASLLVTLLAIGLAVVSFGALSLPPAVLATLLARRAQHELPRSSPVGAQRLSVLAWWMSVAAMALSLVALVALLLDVARLGELGSRFVDRAR